MESLYKIRRITLLILCLMLAACWERNIETRAKMERAKEKINLPEELEEYGKYNKHRDKLFRERAMENTEIRRADRRRWMDADEGIKNGTLMEKYSDFGRHHRRKKQTPESDS